MAIRRPPLLALWRLLSHVRRLGWGVADQAISSVTNFAMVLYVAHAVGAAQFGAFSLAYVTYTFALNASRGLASEPLMVRFNGVDLQTWRRAVGRCTGTAVVVGVATGACVLVVTAVVNGAAKSAFLALGLTLPALLLQDSWRMSFFALGRGGQAFLNDLIWLMALIPALILLRAAQAKNLFWFVFAWGAAAAVAAAAGLLQARVAPWLTGVRGWLSQHRDLGYRYLAENTINSGAVQFRTFGLGLILGLASVGYVQAANTLMGPVMVALMGMGLIGVPEAGRILRRSPQRLALFCLLVSSGLAIAAVAWGAVLLVALPRGLGTLLLRSIWRPTYPLLLPYALSVVGICASGGAIVGLHALGAARRSLRAMIFMSTASCACGLVGALSGGVLGSVRGLAIAAWLGALVWWWHMHRAMRESGIAPVRGRHATQNQQPATKPTRRAATTGLVGSDVTSPVASEANGQLEHTGDPESATEPELAGIVRASRKPSAAGGAGSGWPAQPQPSSPGARAHPASAPRTRSAPPVSARPGWTVVVASDRRYYNRMSIARALFDSSVAFPVYSRERQFPLAGFEMRIGRHSPTHHCNVEIDLAGPPADPGVSRLHAVLIAAPDGTWAVLDPGSANGTLLNGRKIAIGDLVALHDGDRINLGAWTVITVHCTVMRKVVTASQAD